MSLCNDSVTEARLLSTDPVSMNPVQSDQNTKVTGTVLQASATDNLRNVSCNPRHESLFYDEARWP